MRTSLHPSIAVPRVASPILAGPRRSLEIALILPLLYLTGCASYERIDLPTATNFASDVAHLTVDRASLHLPVLASHPFDPTDGLDMDEVAMVAVVNNADLRVARADAGLARAQAFSAGLLPDPQLSLGFAPAPADAGATSAFNAGLTFDVIATLTRPARRRAGEADVSKADLTLLWQEWQVVAQARLLYLKVVYQDLSADLLRHTKARFEDRYARTKQALDAGLISSDAVTPHLSALQDVERQLNELERQSDLSRHDLNLLIGIAPEQRLQLFGTPSLPAIDDAAVRRALLDLARRRPDLLALARGFDAEDERYRAALLAQFPTVMLGPAIGRDTSNVHTFGVAATIGVPIFSGNRGAIAVEMATRQKLRDDFQARLNAADADVERLLADQDLLARQLDALARSVTAAEQSLAMAQAAFDAGNLDALTLTNIEATTLARRLEQLAVQQAQSEGRVSLQTLIGGVVPAAVALGTT